MIGLPWKIFRSFDSVYIQWNYVTSARLLYYDNDNNRYYLGSKSVIATTRYDTLITYGITNTMIEHYLLSNNINGKVENL